MNHAAQTRLNKGVCTLIQEKGTAGHDYNGRDNKERTSEGHDERTARSGTEQEFV